MSRPLVVDLDGTLLRSDVLIESGFSYLKSSPLRFLAPLWWLAQGGKPTLKAKLAAETELDVSVLPYDPQIVEWLKGERATGRTIVLATATHEKYAYAIARHLQLFDEVFATDDEVNLSAHRKKDRLVARFGEQGFDYAGNSRDDLPVWQAAARAYIVNAPATVRRAAEKVGNIERVFDSRHPVLKTWAKSLRMHQWLKNLLIFVPLLAGHMLGSPRLIADAILAFVSFGLCASSVYLLNDLLDLEDDRHHPTKCRRPFACGALPLAWGLAAFPMLLGGAFAMALSALPWRLSAVLLGYYALTLAYSAVLKRLVMVDVVVLAMLYTVRIVAGDNRNRGRPDLLAAGLLDVYLSQSCAGQALRGIGLDEKAWADAIAGTGLRRKRSRTGFVAGLCIGIPVSASVGDVHPRSQDRAALQPSSTHLARVPPSALLDQPHMDCYASRTHARRSDHLCHPR